MVTVTRDNPQEFLRTATSHVEQVRPADKVVVVDSSIPKNASAVKALCEEFGFLYLWRSPDGVYPAMNQGFRDLDDYEWVMFLNSGDHFSCEDSLAVVEKELGKAEDSGTCWAVGRCTLSGLRDREFLTYRPRFGYWNVRLGTSWFPHPSTFYKVSALKNIGGFDVSADLAADYVTALTMFKRFGKPQEIVADLAVHYTDGISSTRPFRGAWQGALGRIQVFGAFQVFVEIITLIPLFASRQASKWLSRLPAKRLPS